VSDIGRRLRARELGIAIGELPPGALDAITDVLGVRVGHTTLIEGDSVRTGVTVVIPPELPCFAAPFRLNGNGEMTGLEWVRESGLLTSQIAITNTHSVGVVRDALVTAGVRAGDERWHLPVVAETWDGRLNDINGMHVTAEHVFEALESAAAGPVAEGSVGGGTGMVCNGFKGGIGTSSRKLSEEAGGYTVGALVQCNYGRKMDLRIAGVPVGREIAGSGTRDDDAGSIIIVVATDAPLLPTQLKRLARRASLGLARDGSIAGNGSGDIFIAFSTANPGAAKPTGTITLTDLPNDRMNPLFSATVQAVEEAIVNAMVAAETMKGANDLVVRALPHDELRRILKKYNRLVEPRTP
jgi:L-aminopeptidase/D-esterase-like protein